MAAPSGSPPGPLVRRAGSGRTEGGDRVWWSVAEGRRGRRWRETVVAEGEGEPGGDALRHSLLLETSPDGRFSHLELSLPAGLLTLHPEGDGTLHGNAVARDGVDHVRGVTWEADGLVLVEGSPVSSAAAARLLAMGDGARVRRRRRILRISRGLRLAADLVGVDSLGNGRWRVIGDPGEIIAAGRDGLPVLVEPRDWPLELSE